MLVTMEGRPRIRAGWPKLAVGFVKRLPLPSPDAIFERIGALRARIREASFREFLECQEFVTLAEATIDVLGLVEARRFWQDVMLAALRQPAVGELVRRAGVGNVEAVPLLERTADAFQFVHQNCGTWIVEADAQRRSAVVTLADAPAVVAESRGMLAAYSGNLSAALVSLAFAPRIAATSDPPTGRLQFKLRW